MNSLNQRPIHRVFAGSFEWFHILSRLALRRMFKALKLVLAAGVTLSLALVAPSANVSAAQAATNNCVSAPSLGSAQKATNANLGSGVELNTYTFNPGAANSSFFYTKVTVAHGNLSQVDLVNPHSPIGEADAQSVIAGQVKAIAYINGDYYREGDSAASLSQMAYSAIIDGGKLIYSPLGSSKVAGTESVTYSMAEGFAATKTYTVNKVGYKLAGVNLSSPMALNTTRVFTSAYSSATLPTNAGGILVLGGKVLKVYKTNVKTKPKSGLLLVATGISAIRMTKVKVGSATTFKLPSVPAPSKRMKFAYIAPNGKVSIGSDSVAIQAVNYDGWANGARLYDSNFTKLRYTTRGDYTVILDSNSKVIYHSSPGRDKPVPAGGYVLQLGADGAAFYRAAINGAAVKVSNTYRGAANGFISASGNGGHVLANSYNSQPCDSQHEQIRPRTAMGWNNSTGEVWILTASSGQDLNDFGFRMGGATVHQSIDWLKQLGATDAVTVDGGGSTTFLQKLGFGYSRADIPDSAWIREVPVGIALAPKD